MKKAISVILAVLVVFAIVALLTSCSRTDTDALDGHGKRFETIYTDSRWRLDVLVDLETGVEYMRFGNRIQPVIDSYGKPYIYPAFDAREDAP